MAGNWQPTRTLWLVSGILLSAAAHANETPARPNAFSVVPNNHWSLQAEEHLAQIGVLECGDPKVFETRPMTRYEMAVGVARTMGAMERNPGLTQANGADSLSVRDIMTALTFEYRDEQMRLGTQDPMTSGSYEIEAYFQTKAQLPMNSTEWYYHDHSDLWTKDYQENLAKLQKANLLRESKIPVPPRLTITPSIVTNGAINKTPETQAN